MRLQEEVRVAEILAALPAEERARKVWAHNLEMRAVCDAEQEADEDADEHPRRSFSPINLQHEYLRHYNLAGRGALGSGQHHGRLSGPRAAVAASKWFASGSQDVASFLWLCTSLSLDPDEIRRALPKVPEHCHDEIRRAPLRYRLEWGV